MKKFFLPLLLACGWGTALRAADSPWITFPAGQAFNLVETPEGANVRIPIKLEANPKSLKLQQPVITDVAAPNNDREEKYVEAFNVTLEEETAGHGANLLIKVHPLSALGTYLVQFRLEAKPVGVEPSPTPTAPPPQTYDLRLQRPAAQLASFPLIVVMRQTRGYWGSTVSTESTMTFSEVSKVSALSALRFHDVSAFPGREAQKLAFIEAAEKGGSTPQPVENVTVAVPANRFVQKRVTALGDFPLGTTNGKLRLESDQLATFPEVDYQVIARRTTLDIIWLATFGILVGYVLRIWLVRFRTTLQARLSWLDADGEMQDAMRLYADSNFLQTIHGARFELSKASNSDDATAINAAVTEARKTLAKQREELQNALKKLNDDRLAPLTIIKNVALVLPNAAQQTLERCRKIFGSIEAMRDRYDVGGANVLLNELQQRDLVQLIGQLNQWRRQAVAYLPLLKPAPVPLTASAIAQLGDDIKGWLTEYETVPNDPLLNADDKPFQEALRDALNKTHYAYAAACEIARELPEWSEAALWEIRSKYKSHGLSVPAEVENLTKTTSESGKAILADLQDPKVGARAFTVRLESLRQAWLDALTANPPAGANLDNIRAALNGSKWIEAVDSLFPPNLAITNQSELVTPNGNTVLKSIPSGVTSEAPLTPNLLSVSNAIGAAHGILPPEKARQRYLRQDRWANLLQTLVLGALFVLAVWCINLERWVGTPQDMLTIFMLAFGFDITAANVITAAKGSPVLAPRSI